MWELNNSALLSNETRCATISDNIQHFAAGIDNQGADIFDYSFTEIANSPITGSGAAVFDIKYSPDGSYLAIAHLDVNTGLVVYDTSNYSATIVNDTTGCRSCSWSEDGNYLVGGHSDDRLRVYDASTFSEIAESSWLTSTNVNGCSITPNFVLGTGGSSLTVVDRSTWSLDTNDGYLLAANGIQITTHPNGDIIAVSLENDDIEIIDTSNFSSVTTLIEPLGNCEGIAFHPSGDYFSAASYNGETHVYDTSTWSEITESPISEGNSRNRGTQFSEDGTKLLVSGSSPDTAWVYNAPANSVSPTISVPLSTSTTNSFEPTVLANFESINGIVYDEVNTPVPGVTVKAFNINDETVEYAITDSDGYFTFGLLNHGLWNVMSRDEDSGTYYNTFTNLVNVDQGHVYYVSEGSGTTLHDSLAGTTANLINTSWVSDATAYDGYKIYLNGNAYAYIPIADRIEINDNGLVVLTAEITDLGGPDPSTLSRFASHPDIANDNRVYMSIDNQTWNHDLHIGLGSDAHLSRNIFNLQVNTKYRIGLQWHNGNYEVRVNNTLVDSGTYPGTINMNTENFFFGTWDATQEFFDGHLDSMKVLYGNWTDEQWTDDYNEQPWS